ncbi:Cys-tRNA(Pro)/Cys-tRNA(Cys) deacylase YbaK [Apilactobacillus kunkeei]|uniref:aminoacyl-tRNA deacylase n=1 Tax=Apilactobacillus kunkeei TaxID=148814 RepID=UPI001C6F6998|nr:aminoacyl-tRNA deacylase [Apilactobacillus kunkeei]MBX8455082.1 aminoacyl-tRNA deacylase [Apilactobacillus kunkeei]QYU54619.1 aminoacyl-tRNA deacylase [Apilactobacillus kunkeei]CAI2560378.1 Cys-tRNA(Pro)/Cys-tRNA(Cys) deacylase YbaK [Apilactobacillus kunkeei]CAI2560450.1 Cys-tRNA(Pro)/Cys-tRNA(Cys) deacylase YbaK [Apilactobacillus kunkeei]CAI2560844.1 Cys-tRNA(Pro)/Cys-tRNA(Cys) deacylase YbaK [Apilactobacillus kunkeei]
MGKKKKNKVHKTLVEQILDKNNISYIQHQFATHDENNVAQLEVEEDMDQHRIYKTLVLEGKETGPVVGVVPLDQHLDEKRLAKESGNKKVNMVPLKGLLKTTGYVHGANTPVGIYEKFHYPIYIDNEAKRQGQILVSSGQVGRSVELDATDLVNLVHGHFVDIVK